MSVVSTVIATLFLRTTLHTSSTADGQTYLGLLFFAIIHMVRAAPSFTFFELAAGQPRSIHTSVHVRCAHVLYCAMPVILFLFEGQAVAGTS